jgi:hypothetical protein
VKVCLANLVNFSAIKNKRFQEQIAGVKFCFTLAKKFSETTRRLKQAFGEEVMRVTKPINVKKRFKEGPTSVGDN